MKPKMKLATDAFLLKDIALPKFYSVHFELYMDAPETDDGKIKLILGLTKGLGISGVGNREPSFEIETNDLNQLNFVTKISSGKKVKHEALINSEWYSKWLSFKIIRCLLDKQCLSACDKSYETTSGQTLKSPKFFEFLAGIKTLHPIMFFIFSNTN